MRILQCCWCFLVCDVWDSMETSLSILLSISPFISTVQFSAVQFNHSVMSDYFLPHGLQHTRPPCPSPIPRTYSNSCSLNQWSHPTISSSVVPFSHLQLFPASGSFQMSQFFASGGQALEFQLLHQSFLWIFRNDFLYDGLVGESKGFSRVFSNTTVQKHQFFGA